MRAQGTRHVCVQICSWSYRDITFARDVADEGRAWLFCGARGGGRRRAAGAVARIYRVVLSAFDLLYTGPTDNGSLQ